MKKLPVIFITSSGRSGSTLLDLMLAQHSTITSVGEIFDYDKWMENNWSCLCKNPIRECEYWSQVRHVLPGKDQFRIGHLSKRQIRKSLLVRPSPQEAIEYCHHIYKLYEAVLKHSESEFIVDSSKSVQQLLYLLESNLFDTNIIHLIRNGKSVVNSTRKSFVFPESGKKSRPQSPFYSSTRWLVHNIMRHRLSKQYGRQRYILVRYEDIATEPRREMQRICRKFNLEYEASMSSPSSKNIHTIGGSRWRFTQSLSGTFQIKLDERWKTELSNSDRLVFNLIGGFLNRIYGYE